ncbi:baeRF7 domain-containing protein [Oscillatoria salina]|uniref:baeRF7 domain-containing protein n=1 Tax=Oscillatoria salina TaxID=331517 RepID=UPI0013B6F561|nr:hypothetical protein [Oscillatoria salina]MBZ8180773.1 hypothetical protein [Oscillatoria salina IIICB1]NET88241.1 hypothetical protein [Kamptonema sp. SIO1D9]
MALLSKNELETLVNSAKGHCVSIYMPTVEAGQEIRQNPIRFKNLMGEAEKGLIANGLDRAEAVRFLEPAWQLDNVNFWRYQNHGLVIFLADNFIRYYRVPQEFAELVVVGSRFHLKPLLPLLTGDGQFYVLGLSQNQVRLLEGTRDRIQEVNLNSLEEVPQSLAEALKYDDPEKQVQYHSSDGGQGVGFPSPIYHGQGVGTTEDKENIKRFFDKLDAGLQEFLRSREVPLVLAGVEYLQPIYQETNSYPHLLAEGINGNPENMVPQDLHDQAWAIVQPHFQQAQKDAANRFHEFAGNSPEVVSSDVSEIVKAAFYQRVDTLFVTVGHQQWGKFNRENNAVELHDSEQPGDEDLLDLAALHTLLNGGTVFAIAPHHLDTPAPLAAIFRY